MIYFDNAATTFPKPQRVEKAVMTAMQRYGANPGRSGHTLSMETAEKVFECREAAAALFGATAVEDVVFTCNCTHAINTAIKGIVEPGDHVIISDLEHNSVLRPVHGLSQKNLITYSVAQVQEDDDATVAAFESLINPATKLVACTHGSNVFGIRLPIQQLGEMCARHDILFLVDAAQTAGVVDIDMNRCQIDFLCTAGHKSLYGPSGTGMLITPLGSVLETLMEGGTGSHSADFDMSRDMPDRLESGTANTAGILGLRAGLDYVKEKGVETIYQHEMKIASRIYRRLRETKGVILYTSGFEAGKHLPVVSFNLEGMMSEEVTMELSDMGFAVRGGLHCAPLAHTKMGTMNVGTVRVSVGAYNTSTHADRFCDAVSRIAKGRGGKD